MPDRRILDPSLTSTHAAVSDSRLPSDSSDETFCASCDSHTRGRRTDRVRRGRERDDSYSDLSDNSLRERRILHFVAVRVQCRMMLMKEIEPRLDKSVDVPV